MKYYKTAIHFDTTNQIEFTDTVELNVADIYDMGGKLVDIKYQAVNVSSDSGAPMVQYSALIIYKMPVEVGE